MAEELIRVEHLKKYFKVPAGTNHAVDDVSFTISKGETLGVVGESGCGKSTLGRTLIHLLESTDGKIFLEGKDITHVKGSELKRIREKMQIADPDEYLNDLVGNLRESFRNGDITETHPNYEKLSQLLIDWDKGSDYIFAHYPELLESARERGIIFSLEDALEQFRRYARGESFSNDLLRFNSLEVDYHPENTEPGRNGGIFMYDIGSFTEDRDVWSVGMLYYVRDEVYYLVDYSVWCGSTGG